MMINMRYKCLWPLLWHVGQMLGPGDLPEEPRSCQAGQAGRQCQGRGSQGLIHRRIPDITNCKEHRAAEIMSSLRRIYKKWWEWSDCLIIWIDTWCPMLLIKDHWMWWYCEDLQIILRDKSVKSPGGKQDHNGLRSTARSSGLRRRWSNEAIP